jgi:hypothetical protein
MKFVFWPQTTHILVPVKRKKYLEWTNVHALVSYVLKKSKIEQDKPVIVKCSINGIDSYTYEAEFSIDSYFLSRIFG